MKDAGQNINSEEMSANAIVTYPAKLTSHEAADMSRW